MTPQAKEVIKSVSGAPTKNFFVEMLTRDIELQDAILDLLDNCVDGVIRTRSKVKAKRDSLQGYWAHIKFNENKFSIEDNCGGIPWKLAKNYAFRMGRPEGSPTEPGSIGIVGIGMKRAIFKMGRECYVHSNHSQDTFLVSIPPDWFNNDTWEFKADREKPVANYKGTILEITELTEPTQVAFKNGSSFRDNFNTIVGEAYSYLIAKGFEIKINGEPVKRKPVKLCFEERQHPKKKGQFIRPYIYSAMYDGVDVFVAVGYRSRMLLPKEQDDPKLTTFAARESGWTIVCNDRVVLANDRSVKTGWGFGGVPNFHNQFSCIAGVVEFKSNDMSKLPITTTKRGIDAGRDIYILVRQRMQAGLKIFTDNTNKWKGYESELKNRFDRSPFLDLTELKHVSSQLDLNKVSGEGIQRQYRPDPPEKRVDVTTRRVTFTKEIKKIELVSRYLFDEVRNPSEVGEACFDAQYKQANK